MSQFLSFWQFFSEAFVPLNGLELPLKPLHKGVCDTLEKAYLGDLGKSFVVINIPPRVGKTKILEALSCWSHAYFPDAQNIYTSYSNELAKTSVRYIQETMTRPWYTELFPTRLGNIRQADHFTTTAGGKVYGDGVGGSLTGLGAGLKRRAGGFIAIDDPAKPDEAMSRVEGEKLRFWFENTLKSRRNSSQYTPIIICAQRLASDDLPGFILENYPNDVSHVKYPALVDGESVIPETVSTKDLMDTQRVNPFAFAAQYQQEPVMMGGNLIKLGDFKYYDPNETPKMELKIITCDTAMKAKESNDYSVLQCWGRSMRRAFLIDQVRGKWQPADLLRISKQFWDKHNRASSPVAYIAIEEAAAGFSLMLEMRKKGIPAKGIIRHKDKVTRVKDILAYQATGMVFLPRTAPWLPAFEIELAQFREDGKSTKDDQCVLEGTKVLTGKGWLAIEKVVPGDLVHTRMGLKRVQEKRCTGAANDPWILVTSSGKTLYATGNHPIWVEGRGFTRVDSLSDGDLIGVWQTLTHSFLTESLFAAIPIAGLLPIADIIAHRETTSEKASSISTRKSGKPTTGKTFLMDMSFTISTETLLTMPSKILMQYLCASILLNIEKEGISPSTILSISPQSGPRPQNGTARKKGLNGTGNTGCRCSTPSLSAMSDVQSVVDYFKLGTLAPDFVRRFAWGEPGEKTPTSMRKKFALYVLTLSESSNASSVAQIERLASIVRGLVQEKPEKVYNLKVEECPEYVAEGILTHNCDAFADGVALLLVKGTSILSVLGGRK